jgi:putative NADH-flavin reductase
MKLAILGATGTVGWQIVTQALAAGYDVTVLVRQAHASSAPDARYTRSDT